MPTAAIPKYLIEEDFRSASPALRFGMYLKLWGIDSRSKERLWTTHDVNYRRTGRDRTERRFEDENKTSALDAATPLGETDRKSMAAHLQRQRAIFDAAVREDGLELMAKSVAPFTTGMGNEHPLENGFAFLNPYGLPYLPGSGVKGVVRRAAEELAHSDLFDSESGWTLPAIWHLFGFEPWLASRGGEPDAEWQEWIAGFTVSKEEIDTYLSAVLDDSASNRKLRGSILESSNPLRTLLRDRNLHTRGALEFWDVVPQIGGNKLAVEIMTPHQSHYYDHRKPHADSNSPHDSGQPNPISFLTVPPESDFVFHVRCDHRRLSRCAPELARDGSWRTLLEAAFEHAFEWLGFGAKTAVGYGAMKRDQADTARQPSEGPAWVENKIEEISQETNTQDRDVALRSRKLADDWHELEDSDLKREAFEDIRARWQDNGWWDTPPGKAARAAKSIYVEYADDS